MFTTTSVTSIEPEPWKNGRGRTRELATGPGWRVSLAEVSCDGPFSIFRRMDRHSVVIEGDACQLRSGETLVELRPFTVVQYPGGLAWTCTLGGHMATVFNVMCESGRWRAIIHIARDRLELDGCAGELILFPVNCSILVMTPVDGVTVIPQGHVAVCTQAHGVVYPVDRTESGFVLIVRLLACAS